MFYNFSINLINTYGNYLVGIYIINNKMQLAHKNWQDPGKYIKQRKHNKLFLSI